MAALIVTAPRAAAVGDLCILLVPSRPVSCTVVSVARQLQREYGGRIVDPLHVTVDRVPGDDADSVLRAVRECAHRLRPVNVHTSAIFVLTRQVGGSRVLKFELDPDPDLDHDFTELTRGLRAAKVGSLYGPGRWTTVTVLSEMDVPGTDAKRSLGNTVALFVADTVIVSRIAGNARYETLESVTIPANG